FDLERLTEITDTTLSNAHFKLLSIGHLSTGLVKISLFLTVSVFQALSSFDLSYEITIKLNVIN
ncbi:hypothetical protein, partial [Aquiflexum sp.]|uniref:hypothetical protein n=1 Tax=Aquiflexum sp. TaxID=1872584 RepID=UPI003593058A